jgi:hypothetical protein
MLAEPCRPWYQPRGLQNRHCTMHRNLAIVSVAFATACASRTTEGPAPIPVAISTAPTTNEPVGDYRRSLGVVTAPAPAVVCFSGSTLGPGADVLIFEDGDTAVAILRAIEAACPSERGGHAVDATLRERTILKGKAGAVDTIGVGVLSSGEGVRLLANGSVDLDGDGKAERFASCTSSEGVHLTVWSGPIGESVRLWHSYVYLGYDTEPTCTEAEMAAP